MQKLMDSPIPRGDIRLISTSFEDILFAFPICVLSFLSSFNVLAVHGSLVDPTRLRLRRVIRLAIETCCL